MNRKQRIDRWLWHARVVKTRLLSASLTASGCVRVNGKRVEAPSYSVREGDVLTVALPCTIRVLRVADIANRRGTASDAKRLYEELRAPISLTSEPHLLAKRQHVR